MLLVDLRLFAMRTEVKFNMRTGVCLVTWCTLTCAYLARFTRESHKVLISGFCEYHSVMVSTCVLFGFRTEGVSTSYVIEPRV